MREAAVSSGVARLLALLLLMSCPTVRGEEITTELLVVGGTESGWAAAIQAARMGVKSVTVVHDGNWLGGQYTEQGLACVDENMGVGKVGWGPNWHPMKRAFHRFGLFKELMDRIESHNTRKYGSPMPGRPSHGPTTFRPAEAEAIFREMLQPYIASGQVRLYFRLVPAAAILSPDGRRVTGMDFRPPQQEAPKLRVNAALTIDASDWGDAIRLAGAAFEVGPDPRARYGEPSAQVDVSANPPNEMNPITWTIIVEEGGDATPIPIPPHYDERRYYRGSRQAVSEFRQQVWDRPARHAAIAPWPPAGKSAARQGTILTMRRIVEGTTSKDGRTASLLCYAHSQDYPLERLPRRVADALEETESGAAQKNIVLMTPEQRQLVFDDARAHSLGFLHFLQTFTHERVNDTANSLRKYRLSSEFGTPDRLPPKPYIRESLRLKALYMMREQDGLTDGKTKKGAEESFARVMYPDGLFGWQFHYDFHDTGRAYLRSEGDSGPWTQYEKPGRGVHHLSDRSVFPLRSLIPAKTDGLIGAQGNVGYSSIVSSAIRLHDQRIHIGQAAAATAVLCLKYNKQPRELAWNRAHLEDIRHALCGGTEGTPLLLWPYRDLPTDHPCFVAVNRLAARGLLPMSRREVDFRPDALATREWQEAALDLCSAQSLKVVKLVAREQTRGEFARRLWQQVENQQPPAWRRQAADDADGDGVLDSEDPLPFSAAPNSWQSE